MKNYNLFSQIMPKFDENAIAGRISGAKREGLLAEGGLRTQGIYRVSTDEFPLVSIITVVFNGAAKLERAMQSVFNQTYPNIEYIIVDGGSTDGSLDIIEKNADKIDYYVSQKDHGIYDAMNKGVALSSGKFIGVVNADDMMFKDGIYDATQELLATNSDFIVTPDYLADTNGNFVGIQEITHIDEGCLLGKHPCSHGAMIIGKKAYDKAGYYDTKYKIASDYKLEILICMNNELKGCKLPKSIHYFELGGVSFLQQDAVFGEISDIVKEFIPRINREHLESLLHLMWWRQWNEKICTDLEQLLKSGVYNDIQQSYLLNEMLLFGYDGKYKRKRRITLRKLIKYILPYGIVNMYKRNRDK